MNVTHLYDLEIGNSLVSLGKEPLALSNCTFENRNLDITIFHQSEIWDDRKISNRQSVFNLSYPDEYNASRLSELKGQINGNLTRCLNCVSSDMDDYLSPAVDKIALKFNSESLASWEDCPQAKLPDRKLKAVLTDLFWGLIMVYPIIRISKVPISGKNNEYNFYFKIIDDPFFIICFKYRNESSVVLELVNRTEKYLITK